MIVIDSLVFIRISDLYLNYYIIPASGDTSEPYPAYNEHIYCFYIQTVSFKIWHSEDKSNVYIKNARSRIQQRMLA